MAEIAYSMEEPAAGSGDQLPPGCFVVKWGPLANGDTGKAIPAAEFPDKAVQVTGTFGTGGNCRIEGSNVATGTPIWATLTDPQGNALDITAAKIEQVQENTYQVRPNITAGDGTTSLTVRLLLVKIARR